MYSVVLRKPALGLSGLEGKDQQLPAAPGCRLIAPAALLAAAIALSGCAHSNPEMAANGTTPRVAAAHASLTRVPRTRAAKLRAIRRSADARADVNPTAKPTAPGGIPLPGEALLKRQPPPDCKMRTQPAGVSPTDVKLATYDYERQCYRQVEGIVRGRLDALQDAVEVTIKAVKARQGTGQARNQVRSQARGKQESPPNAN